MSTNKQLSLSLLPITSSRARQFAASLPRASTLSSATALASAVTNPDASPAPSPTDPAEGMPRRTLDAPRVSPPASPRAARRCLDSRLTQAQTKARELLCESPPESPPASPCAAWRRLNSRIDAGANKGAPMLWGGRRGVKGRGGRGRGRGGGAHRPWTRSPRSELQVETTANH